MLKYNWDWSNEIDNSWEEATEVRTMMIIANGPFEGFSSSLDPLLAALNMDVFWKDLGVEGVPISHVQVRQAVRRRHPAATAQEGTMPQ